MTKLNTALSVILIIAVAFLFRREFSSETESSRESGTTLSATNDDVLIKPIRIAYIITDSLIKNYDYHKELSMEIEAKAKILEKDIDQKRIAFEENLTILQQQSANMSQEQMQEAQLDLQRAEQNLLAYRDSKAQELNVANQELNMLILDDMKIVIDSIQKEMNLDFILSKDPNSILLQANADYDITSLVAERLNENYKNRKK